ncbi:hypothetical protein D9M70_481100 [compost metagenome]
MLAELQARHAKHLSPERPNVSKPVWVVDDELDGPVIYSQLIEQPDELPRTFFISSLVEPQRRIGRPASLDKIIQSAAGFGMLGT